MAMTAGKTARMFGISRTALLYYDEIGLVSPAGRSPSGYRLYSEDDLKRLQTVISFRDAGIALDDISRILSGSENTIEVVLLKRLNELNSEIIAIKKRQAAVIGMIQDLTAGETPVNKEKWRAGLAGAGIVEGKAAQLHEELEAHSPEMHIRFLRALGFDDEEIRIIREYHSQG